MTKRNCLIGLILLVSVLIALNIEAVTKTYIRGGKQYWNQWMETKAVDITTADVNDFSETVEIYGHLQTLCFSPIDDFNDTEFSITLSDSVNATIWSKDDCDGLTAFRYALTEANTADTHFRGIPVVGQITVSIADANTTGVGGFLIRLYYDEKPQAKP